MAHPRPCVLRAGPAVCECSHAGGHTTAGGPDSAVEGVLYAGGPAGETRFFVGGYPRSVPVFAPCSGTVCCVLHCPRVPPLPRCCVSALRCRMPHPPFSALHVAHMYCHRPPPPVPPLLLVLGCPGLCPEHQRGSYPVAPCCQGRPWGAGHTHACAAPGHAARSLHPVVLL
jgi:hypothetical protein